MASYRDAIDVPTDIEETFDYLADFSRTAEWDPGVVSASPITNGAPSLGSEFAVNISAVGRELPLRFEITEYKRPDHLVLSGGNSIIRSVDQVSFTALESGTRVTYEAHVHLVGLSQLADPLLHVLLQRVGSVAIRGLRERLSGGNRLEQEPTKNLNY